jgi:hypothetical protein
MAAEALDIKTLTTLIMATPKTDIEQSVGRILREKHSSPIVVDIVDSHDLFQNQWRKRKTFYKKENYKIIYVNSNNYTSNTDTWQVVFSPKGAKTCKPDKEKTAKNISIKSNSSSDRSIAGDTDDEEEENDKPKDKYLTEQCFLKIKK